MSGIPSDALSQAQGSAIPAASVALNQAGAGAMPRKGLAALVPALNVMREYQFGRLRNDIVAGIVLSTMLVPVGIVYAVASGVPAIYGLYATIVPLIAYAIFDPSRILGPDSSLAPLILGAVLPLSADPGRAVAIASAMAVGKAAHALAEDQISRSDGAPRF